MAVKLELDEKLIRQLAAKGNSMSDIAYELGVSNDTLYRHYREVMEAGRAEGRAMIREMMWHHAAKGNLRAVGMLAQLHLKPDEVDTVEAEYSVVEAEEIGALLEQAGCKD